MMDFSFADSAMQSGVDDGVFTHAACRIAIGGETVLARSFGESVAEEVVYDIASLTKPLCTATLLLQSVERGELHLGEMATSYLEPVYGALPHMKEVTVEQLATHTSGLAAVPSIVDIAAMDRAAIIGRIAESLPETPPGAIYRYSDIGYILLGEILSNVARQPLDVLFRTRISEPAGLSKLGFLPTPEWAPRIAPTSTAGALGVVHDPRARELAGVAGHAGLFGTADTVMALLEIIRTGGGPCLSPASTARMASSRLAPAVGAHSIGWFCYGNNMLPAGDMFSRLSFGHTGFTGVLALVDPTYDASVVLLTNRVINEAEGNGRYLKLRRRWMNAVAATVSQRR